MKNQIILLVLFAVIFWSCEEVGPNLNISSTNTGEGQVKNVLIEEFTGVQCVNCPAGSALIEQLIGQHGDRLIAVSIHAGFFANPYPDSNEDLSTDEGENIQAFLDQPIGYPTAVIDRMKFDSEDSRQLDKNKWAGYISSRLLEETPVELQLSKSYNTDTREVSISLNTNFLETITDPLRVTIYVTENNVVDAQLTPESTGGSPDLNYVHKHVFREAVTNYDGYPITTSTAQGENTTLEFTTTLAANWNAANCHLIAFISKNGTDLDVLQAVETSILD